VQYGNTSTSVRWLCQVLQEEPGLRCDNNCVIVLVTSQSLLYYYWTHHWKITARNITVDDTGWLSDLMFFTDKLLDMVQLPGMVTTAKISPPAWSPHMMSRVRHWLLCKRRYGNFWGIFLSTGHQPSCGISTAFTNTSCLPSFCFAYIKISCFLLFSFHPFWLWMWSHLCYGKTAEKQDWTFDTNSTIQQPVGLGFDWSKQQAKNICCGSFEQVSLMKCAHCYKHLTLLVLYIKFTNCCHYWC